MSEKRILWLVSWYPNSYDFFDGDFIQRHAQTAAIHHNIYVIFVKPLKTLPLQTQSISQNGNLTEKVIFIKEEHGLLKKFRQHPRWFCAYKHSIEAYIKQYGFPDLVHVHVPWKAGLVALWLKYKFNVPYVVTEHWGIYNNVVADRFEKRAVWERALFKQIFKNATQFVSVSQFLARQVNAHVVQKQSTVIPNVVDTTVFFYKPLPMRPFTFLHVSNMVPLKNVAGILRAFAQLRKQRVAAKLVLIGNRDAYYKSMAELAQLNDGEVSFLGEVSHEIVAEAMQAAHCLVVASHIENAPCVIGEALCCGTPVIATNVGGISEMVHAENGLLVGANDDAELQDGMLKLIKNYNVYDRENIAWQAAAAFGTASVSIQFQTLYSALSSSRNSIA